MIQLESKRCTTEKWGCEVPFYTLGLAKKWDFIHRMEQPTDTQVFASANGAHLHIVMRSFTCICQQDPAARTTFDSLNTFTPRFFILTSGFLDVLA